MEKIRWSPKATDDLASIHEHISQDSVFYADRQIETLIGRVEQLHPFPYSGRKAPEFNDDITRELIEGRYRIVYEINDDHISILHVLHSSRKIRR